MSEIFFISDTHFGHRGILSFAETKPFRQFDSIEEHDEELVRLWNATVSPGDTIYHLGDFCFGKRNIEIAGRLNGQKRLILGNHDIYGIAEYLKYFKKVEGAKQFEGMILTHIPVHPGQFPRFFMNVHGHLHTKHILREDGSRDSRYFNVSCENTGLRPIPLDEIYNYWAENND